MSKPVVFLSHVHGDQHIANTLETVVRTALSEGVEILNSSDRGSIAVGDPWRDVIIERLSASRTVLVVATPESVSSPWVNFEAGGAWVTGNRVIPCCVKGMTPSSLPAPLSHLEALDLSSPDDLNTLIKHLAEVAGLDTPSQFDYQQAVATIVRSWPTSMEEPSNEEFLAWIEKVSARPKKYKGATCPGYAKVTRIHAVTPFEAGQFRGENLVAGDSIECWLGPIGEAYSTLYHCFANDPVASFLVDVQKETVLEVTVRCLGQMKVYTTDLAWENDDRGVEYPLALLIENARVKP